MNLGRRRIKNPELCAAFEEMGFENVSAFLASGNVIFDVAEDDATVIAGVIEAGLKVSLGYDVPTFLRTADEVVAIASCAPFEVVAGDSVGTVQVAMFERSVDRDARDAVLGLASDDDRLELRGRELYWLPEGKFLDSKLDLKAIESIVGAMTIRTKRTIERIAARFLAG